MSVFLYPEYFTHLLDYDNETGGNSSTYFGLCLEVRRGKVVSLFCLRKCPKSKHIYTLASYSSTMKSVVFGVQN